MHSLFILDSDYFWNFPFLLFVEAALCVLSFLCFVCESCFLSCQHRSAMPATDGGVANKHLCPDKTSITIIYLQQRFSDFSWVTLSVVFRDSATLRDDYNCSKVNKVHA